MAENVVTANPAAVEAIQIVDEVLSDPIAYRARALTADYRDVAFAYGVTFKGIAPCPFPEVIDWMAQHYPQLRITTTCFRRSPLHQVEPTFVHTDLDMGETSGILYLSPDAPLHSGTTFYRDRTTGRVQSIAVSDAERFAESRAWFDPDRWESWREVESRFGRLILFPSSYFHARSRFENFGEGDQARLIQLLFMTGVINA